MNERSSPARPGARLASHSYGKAGVRLLIRHAPDDPSVLDLSLDVQVRGDFGLAFVHGDNSTTLPTDSMRNHALVLADEMPGAEPEAYGRHLLARLLEAIPAADGASVSVTIQPWINPWHTEGKHVAGPAPVLVPAPWVGRAEVDVTRDGPETITGGLGEFQVLVPFGSGFSGFLRDELTDQADEVDRVMSGRIDAVWRYRDGPIAYGDTRERVRMALATAFGEVPSPGVQHTVYRMACAALDAAPELAGITVAFAARPHRAAGPVAGRPLSGDVWVVGTSPSGITEATVRRP